MPVPEMPPLTIEQLQNLNVEGINMLSREEWRWAIEQMWLNDFGFPSGTPKPDWMNSTW